MAYRLFRRMSTFFLKFWWSKVWGGGLYDEHKTKTVFSESKFWKNTPEYTVSRRAAQGSIAI